MRRIILILTTVVLFGACFACSSSSCSDSGGGSNGPCPPGTYLQWLDNGGYSCVSSCPTGYVAVTNPTANYWQCIKRCSDGSTPTWNYAAHEWECSGDPTSTPTSTPTSDPTSTATATATPTSTATATPTSTATATATPTATPTSSSTSCIGGTWTGASWSNIGWGDQTLVFVINASGTSLSGSVKHTSAGVVWTHTATGTIGSTTPPTSFRFANSADTTYVGTFIDCNTIEGTYTDVHGDSGRFTITKR